MKLVGSLGSLVCSGVCCVSLSSFSNANRMIGNNIGISDSSSSIGDEGAEDGNPKQWSRTRRCDASYETACTACEGIGGMAYGDDKNDITIPDCQVIHQANEIPSSDLVWPKWDKTFEIVKGYHEILIGEKVDPACFQIFPGTTSAPGLCYRAEEGSLYYDMEQKMALQIDLTTRLLGSIPFNISSTVIHHEKNMWIANKLWLGVEMCVCTQFKNIYPLQFDWTEHATYVGRENMAVEYIWKTMTLDHWIIGPHHLWSAIDTGDIVRLWQPWNGLEVLNPLLRQSLTKTIEFPPKMCKKKGGALFRINCDDEGYPATCNAAECDWEEDTTTVKDDKSIMPFDDPLSDFEIKRAHQKIPGDDFRGDHASHSWAVLNTHLESKYKVSRECSKWTVEELQTVQGLILTQKHESFDALYKKTTDKRRLLHRSLVELQDEWKEMNDLSLANPRLSEMNRDGHCAETIMWFIHHLSDSVRKSFIHTGFQVPLLSETQHTCPSDATPEEQRLCEKYEEKVTCATCHSKPNPLK